MNEFETPFRLNEKTMLKNRWFKAAMSEGLADQEHRPTTSLIHLYDEWAKGGAGLIVTGNVMIDRRALGEPRNVVIENEQHLDLLQQWAKAGTQQGAHLWMQVNHPGKQVFKGVVKEAVAPSAIPFPKKLQRFFPPARALTEQEIEELIVRFSTTARIAKKAGFTGVQIHGAHGYLISQFLSPRHNVRKDRWGGSIENRMRFLLEVYRGIRSEVGDAFPIGVKLNSADFMKAGFTEEEAIIVMQALAEAGIDLIEVSGGSYESPQMTGVHVKESTKAREGYFLSFAEMARKRVSAPLVVTGGFRSVQGMNSALKSGATDLIGLARPFAVYPDLPLQIERGNLHSFPLSVRKTGVTLIDRTAMLEMTWYSLQLERIAKGRAPLPNMSPWTALGKSLTKNGYEIFTLKRE